MALGLSLIVPYGLGLQCKTNTSLLRYNVNYDYQKSANFLASIAYKISSQFSVGLGLDVLNYAVREKASVRTQLVTFPLKLNILKLNIMTLN